MRNSTMRNPIEIEDIETLRRREGIEDVELREEIRDLKVGDCVLLTFLVGAPPKGETLLVRITSIRGRTFCGTLARRPPATSQTKLRVGTPIDFTTTHIHSLPKGRPPRED